MKYKRMVIDRKGGPEALQVVEARQAQELILGAKVEGKIVLLCDESMQTSETESPVS